MKHRDHKQTIYATTWRCRRGRLSGEKARDFRGTMINTY
jgi:hypothetical protein